MSGFNLRASKPIRIKSIKARISLIPPPSPTDTIASGFSLVANYTSEQKPEVYPLPTPSTMFSLAMFPYSDPDPAILSFQQNDVIEIISQHPSGWWDGLVGSTWNGYGYGGNVRRGWVPSNYVRLLRGREEARAALIRNERHGVRL